MTKTICFLQVHHHTPIDFNRSTFGKIKNFTDISCSRVLIAESILYQFPSVIFHVREKLSSFSPARMSSMSIPLFLFSSPRTSIPNRTNTSSPKRSTSMSSSMIQIGVSRMVIVSILSISYSHLHQMTLTESSLTVSNLHTPIEHLSPFSCFS